MNGEGLARGEDAGDGAVFDEGGGGGFGGVAAPALGRHWRREGSNGWRWLGFEDGIIKKEVAKAKAKATATATATATAKSGAGGGGDEEGERGATQKRRGQDARILKNEKLSLMGCMVKIS